MHPDPDINIEQKKLAQIIDELNEGCEDDFESIYERTIDNIHMLQDHNNSLTAIERHFEDAKNHLTIFHELIYKMAEEIQKLRSFNATDKALGDMIESVERKTEQRKMPDDLKVTINTILWSNLPPDTTLEEADKIACELYFKIQEMWEEVK